MKFRTIGLISTLVLGLLVAGLSAEAQQAGKVYRIGVLMPGSLATTAPMIDAFRQGLRELGYVEGKNFILEIREGKGKRDQLANLAAELVRLKVDIILATGGGPIIRAAKKATSTIPIVVRTATNLVRGKLIDSLAHPGGNITGVYSVNTGLLGKRMELLAEVVPGLERLAVLSARPKLKGSKRYKELVAAARALGMKLQILKARDANAIDSAFLEMTKGRADALTIIPSTRYFYHRNHILNGAATNRLPLICTQSVWAEDGCLMSYGANYPSQHHRTATFVDKILKGAKPADLPVERAIKYELVINLKTARQIGLTIPPSILYRADKVIK
jgi:putative ABC transport system substrate-binding protein